MTKTTEYQHEYRKVRLSSGVTLVAERHPHVRAVSVGVWVKTGSILETAKTNGISHVVEHMVFKGTETRTPFEISTLLERLGGELNAFTERELTCFHAIVLPEHLDVALDVLSDILLHPTFPKNEVDRERRVLLQELSMIQETPEDQVHENFFQSVWKGQSIGQPIIGNEKNLKRFQRRDIVNYWEEKYVPDNMVISVCGNLEFPLLQERCEHHFKFQKQRQETLPILPAVPVYHSKKMSLVKDTDQLHLMIGFDGVGYRDAFRFDALLMSMFLGGGMSSRLFQEVREKAGLAYTVDCEFIPYSQAGLFIIYAGIIPKNLYQCLKIIGREIMALAEKGMSQEALDMVKGQIRGMILLSSDQVDVRQESLGKNELAFGRYVPVEEVLEEIENVTPERTRELARRVFCKEKESVFTLSKRKIERKGLTVFA